MKRWPALAFLLLGLAPTAAYGAVFVRDEQALSLAAPVDDDLFATGATVLIDQAVSGDVFAAGERVTVSAPVAQDIFAAGGSVEIPAEVRDDLFAAGNTVTITGRADDLFAAGSTVMIAPSTKVAGDAYLAAQTVEIAGTFAGDVRVAGQHVTLKSGTTIAGDLVSTGRTPLIEADVAIKGEKRHEQVGQAATPYSVTGILISVAMWFIAALALVSVFPGFTSEFLQPREGVIKTFFIGAAWLVLCVPLFLLLAVSVIGIPLMLLLVLATLLLLVTSVAGVPLVLGHWIMRRAVKSDQPLSWQYILAGAALFSLLGLVPVIGILLSFVLTVFIFGTLLKALWQRRRGNPV